MKHLETEKKLELVRAIRMQNQYDRQLLRKREGILYHHAMPERQGEIFSLEEATMPISGKYTGKAYGTSLQKEDERKEDKGFLKGVRVRLILAMGLFLAFVYCDVKKINVADKSAQEVLNMLRENQLEMVTENLNIEKSINTSFGKGAEEIRK